LRGSRRVGFRTYRDHRLELLDDGAEGWVVKVRAPGVTGGPCLMLHNRVPNGLSVLVEEARREVDRRLDGADWHRAP
jgi:hypothetical protein